MEKIIRKIFLTFLLVGSVLPLASCDDEESLKDTDFDGLYDEVDPNPESNTIRFNYTDASDPNLVTKEDTLTIDFRKFVFDGKPEFDKDVAKMSALLINSAKDDTKHGFSVLSDEYTNDESEINRTMVQLGFQNVDKIHSKTSSIDQYDICDLYAGNHKMIFNDKKYQIFGFAVSAYPTSRCWFSNFDMGSKSSTYSSLYGEHPDWLNKNHHKGFDVSANRVFDTLNQYVDTYKEDDFEAILYITGQSRGGSIASLLGKRLFDSGVKSVVYAINDPSPVFVDDSVNINDLKKYTNILNINCANDILAQFPFEHWNVARYGRNFVYDFKTHLVEYNEYYGEPYQFLNDEAHDALFGIAKNIAPTRDSMYEFRKPDPTLPETELFDTFEEAEERADELKNLISDAFIGKSVYAEPLPSGDLDKPYMAQYYTRPIIIFQIVADFVSSVIGWDLSISDLIAKAFEYTPFIYRYAGDFLPVLDKWIPVPKEVALSHTEKSCILGTQFAVEVK